MSAPDRRLRRYHFSVAIEHHNRASEYISIFRRHRHKLTAMQRFNIMRGINANLDEAWKHACIVVELNEIIGDTML